jgi:NADH-dependent peroxiredoxin subunit F
MYDLAILGGGPAGVSAGVYAARKKLKTVIIAKDFAGQSVVSDGIENWIGEPKISGTELAKKLESHLQNYKNDIDIKGNHWIKNVTKIEQGFEIETDQEKFITKSILVATGSHRKKLLAENADKFEHKGVTYCASCDGPMFSGKDVLVVGGGNAGFETAAQLLAYTNSVTLIHHNDHIKADAVTVDAVLKDPKMKLITSAEIKKVTGEKFVEGVIYLDKNTNEEKELKATGIFVEIGSTPTTEFVSAIVPLDDFKRIKIDPWTQKSETEGVWAAGDCTNIKYHQNNIASGDAVKAVEDIYLYIKRN